MPPTLQRSDFINFFDSDRHKALLRFLDQGSRERAASAFKMMTHRVPSHFYKYGMVSAPSIKHLVESSQIYFTHPGGFNDPFEMQALIEFKGSDQEKVEALTRMAMRMGCNSKEALYLAVSLFKSNSKIEDLVENSFHRSLERYGIYCLATTPRNILMWSHYSHMHTGLCVQMHAARDPAIFACAFPVDYTNDFPVINWIDVSKNRAGLSPVLLRKAKCWEYENEYRMSGPTWANHILHLRSGAVQGVILGARFADSNIPAVAQMCSNRVGNGMNSIKIYSTRLDRRSYTVRIHRRKDIETTAYGKPL